MYEIQKFIKENQNWKELLQNPPYSLKITKLDNLVMFKYSQIESDFSNQIVCEARGIILEKETWRCICKGFNKFFNYGEEYAAQIDWNSAYITEKIDGSLIKVYYYNGEWRVATNGNIDAKLSPTGVDKYPTFYDLFIEAIKKYSKNFEDFVSDFIKGYTYLFELVSPYNRIVIPYKDFDVYFLGKIHCLTGSLFLRDPYVKANSPKRYYFRNLHEAITAANALDWNEEGYVASDKYGNKVKIKSPSYVVAHHTRANGNISDKNLIHIIRMGEEQEFLVYADEYKERIDFLKNKLIEKEVEAEQLRDKLENFRERPRAEYAEEVKKTPSIYHSYLFKCYDTPQSFLQFITPWTNSKWDFLLKT